MTNYSRLTEIVCKIFDETIDFDKLNNKSISLTTIIDDIYDEFKKDKADKAFENFYKRDLAKLVDWHILEKIETKTSSNIEISYKLHKRLNHLYKFILEENFNSYDVSYILILNTIAVKINKFDKEITNNILENQGFGALVHFSMPTRNLSNDLDEQLFRELLTKRENNKMKCKECEEIILNHEKEKYFKFIDCLRDRADLRELINKDDWKLLKTCLDVFDVNLFSDEESSPINIYLTKNRLYDDDVLEYPDTESLGAFIENEPPYIEIYMNAINACSKKNSKIDFNTLFEKVVYHELAHYVMYNKESKIEKNDNCEIRVESSANNEKYQMITPYKIIEESLANYIAVKQFNKDKKLEKVKNFCLNQSIGYKHYSSWLESEEEIGEEYRFFPNQWKEFKEKITMEIKVTFDPKISDEIIYDANIKDAKLLESISERIINKKEVIDKNIFKLFNKICNYRNSKNFEWSEEVNEIIKKQETNDYNKELEKLNEILNPPYVEKTEEEEIKDKINKQEENQGLVY